MPGNKKLLLRVAILSSLITYLSGGQELSLFTAESSCPAPCCSSEHVCGIVGGCVEPDQGVCTCTDLPGRFVGLLPAVPSLSLQLIDSLFCPLYLSIPVLREQAEVSLLVGASPPVPPVSRHIASTILRI